MLVLAMEFSRCGRRRQPQRPKAREQKGLAVAAVNAEARNEVAPSKRNRRMDADHHGRRLSFDDRTDIEVDQSVVNWVSLVTSDLP